MVASRFCYMAFLIDACTDCQPACVATQVSKIVRHAIDNPGEERPEGELFIGQITKECVVFESSDIMDPSRVTSNLLSVAGRFWQSALKIATPNLTKRFKETFATYLDYVIGEAKMRDTSTFVTVDEFLIHRRECVASLPTLAIPAINLNIPPEAFENPVVKEIENYAADLLFIDNVGL
jgi:Delta6-protoilludene synthase